MVFVLDKVMLFFALNDYIMKKNEIKQSDMKPLIIDSSWTERFLPDPPREKDNRPPFRRDRGRILHSAAIRCLQAKLKFTRLAKTIFIALA